MASVSVADWSSIATAVGTLALAAVTAVSLKYGRDALDQTQDEIALSRREVEEAHRPVLIPDTESVDYSSAQSPKSLAAGRARPVKLHGVRVDVVNIGAGPALHVDARIQLRGDDGALTTRTNTRWWSRQVTGVGVNQTERIVIPVHQLGELPCFMLELRYADVAGKRWITRGLYMSTRATGDVQVFKELAVERGGPLH